MMSHVIYKIVQHDGGWAYTVHGTFSEAFANHDTALAAARRAAAEQRVPGRTEAIEYETPDGKWHTETAAGGDRPEDRRPGYIARASRDRFAPEAAPVKRAAIPGDAP